MPNYAVCCLTWQPRGLRHPALCGARRLGLPRLRHHLGRAAQGRDRARRAAAVSHQPRGADDEREPPQEEECARPRAPPPEARRGGRGEAGRGGKAGAGIGAGHQSNGGQTSGRGLGYRVCRLRRSPTSNPRCQAEGLALRSVQVGAGEMREGLLVEDLDFTQWLSSCGMLKLA